MTAPHHRPALRRAGGLLCLALLGACQQDPEPLVDDVVLITVDTLNPRILLGQVNGWETAPRIMELFDQSAVFPYTLSPRGMTAVALASLHTGLYPREHRVRNNKAEFKTNKDTLSKRFQAAGFTTLGFSANACHIMDEGFDETVCTSNREVRGLGDLRERDEELCGELHTRLYGLRPEERLFLWLHLNQPHKPYESVPHWYEELHPQNYRGNLDPANTDQLDDITLGSRPYGPKDRRHLEATYASQVRDVDMRVGRLLDTLEDLGRLDDALVVFGSDHSEELTAHNRYFFHGCSPYNSVLRVAYSFRGPGLPQGSEHPGWVSMADVMPTISALALAPGTEEPVTGQSLLPVILDGEQRQGPIFFERDTSTAGVLLDGYKYIMSETDGYPRCKPYSDVAEVYAGEMEELYDLENDSEEAQNIVTEQPALRDDLRDEVCAWVTAGPWISRDSLDSSALSAQCVQWLAQ